MSNKRITIPEVIAGFESGLIQLIDTGRYPYYGIGVACKIGYGTLSNWFYFAGWEGESMTADEYLRDIPMTTIADEIVRVLDDFQHGDEAGHDEWLFYRHLIDENMKDYRLKGGLTMALEDELYEIANESVYFDILDTDELVEKFNNHSGPEAKKALESIIDSAVEAAQSAAQNAIWSELCSRRDEVIDILEEG